MSTEIVPAKKQLNPNEWLVMKEQAAMLIKTGFLPPALRTPEQVLAVALTGKELGIGMMEAIRGINIITGKPSVSPQLMLALARRTGELEKFALHAPSRPGIPPDETGAECHIQRRGSVDHVTVFGPDEAKKLGLIGKDNYTKQPGTMYGWRAIAANLRVTFPDAITGLYSPDELDNEMPDSGDVIATTVDPGVSVPLVEMPKEKVLEKPRIEKVIDVPAVYDRPPHPADVVEQVTIPFGDEKPKKGTYDSRKTSATYRQ